MNDNDSKIQKIDEEIAALRKKIWQASAEVNQYKAELHQWESRHTWLLFGKKKSLKKKIDRLECQIREAEESLWQMGQKRKKEADKGKKRKATICGAVCLTIVFLCVLIAGCISEKGTDSVEKETAGADAPVSTIVIADKRDNPPKQTTAGKTVPVSTTKATTREKETIAIQETEKTSPLKETETTTIPKTEKTSTPKVTETVTSRETAGTQAAEVTAGAAEAQTTEAAARQETVYITDTGTKYHRENCRTLKSKHAITVKDAVRDGYSPCKICNP